jgi:hypothetical protein
MRHSFLPPIILFEYSFLRAVTQARDRSGQASARLEAINNANVRGALSSHECSQGHPNFVRTTAGR